MSEKFGENGILGQSICKFGNLNDNGQQAFDRKGNREKGMGGAKNVEVNDG